MAGNIGIFVFEAVITGLITWAGLSNRKILFINGPRSAVIVLGIIGVVAFCTISVGKFISAAPAHPLTIAGYVLGMVAMFTFLTQIFKWNVPIIGEPRTALLVLTGCILVKSIIARVGHVVLHLAS